MNNRKYILVVDDDQAYANLLKDFLIDKGFEVEVAGTAGEGEKKILERCPDLLVLDLYLPDMKGSTLASQLRNNAATRHLPIILCTAYQITREEKMQGFRAGVDDYLVRPYELDELLARMVAVLRRAEAHPKTELLTRISDILQISKEPTSSPTDLPEFPSKAIEDFDFMGDVDDEEPKTPSSAHQPTEFLNRFWQVLHEPRRVFEAMEDHQDFFLSLFLILATPVIGSLSKLFRTTGSFNAWIGFLSLGLVTNTLLWIGIAGVLHLVVPFYGQNLSMKRAFILSGLGWAPRIVASCLSLIYSVIAGMIFGVEQINFSSGLDILLPPSDSSWVSCLSQIGIFNIWCVWITLVGLWTVCRQEERRFNFLSIFVGLLCLAFGALTTY
jgi:DNA-binding response OmpR family regulator